VAAVLSHPQFNTTWSSLGPASRRLRSRSVSRRPAIPNGKPTRAATLTSLSARCHRRQFHVEPPTHNARQACRRACAQPLDVDPRGVGAECDQFTATEKGQVGHATSGSLVFRSGVAKKSLILTSPTGRTPRFQPMQGVRRWFPVCCRCLGLRRAALPAGHEPDAHNVAPIGGGPITSRSVKTDQRRSSC
jgi:hypothetical protein